MLFILFYNLMELPILILNKGLYFIMYQVPQYCMAYLIEKTFEIEQCWQPF